MSEGVRLAGKHTGWPHWTTPEPVLARVRQVGEIGFDPCTNDASIVNAVLATNMDGLTCDWLAKAGQHLVYVNPPYKAAAHFMAKCDEEAARGVNVLALVAARTDTRWAHRAFRTATALCFWGPGRIKFDNPPPGSKGDAPSIPSMFVYWGNHTNRFMSVFQHSGQCIDLRWPQGNGRSFPVQVRP